MEFDPYYKWLAIPATEQPPDFYRLLGLVKFEDDADVISAAADRQAAHVRTYQLGQYSAFSQRLLNEIATARVTLLRPAEKAAYDTWLQRPLAPQQVILLPTALPVSHEGVRLATAPAPQLPPPVVYFPPEQPRPAPATSSARMAWPQLPLLAWLGIVCGGGLLQLVFVVSLLLLTRWGAAGHPELARVPHPEVGVIPSMHPPAPRQATPRNLPLTVRSNSPPLPSANAGSHAKPPPQVTLPPHTGPLNPEKWLAAAHQEKSPDVRYALFARAAEQAAMAGDVAIASEAFRKMGEQHADYTLPRELVAFLRMYEQAKPGFEPAAFAAWGIRVLTRLQQQESLARHTELARITLASAREAGDLDLHRQAALLAAQSMPTEGSSP